MKYTKETLAALLNGREYGDEITDQEEKDAKDCKLVVVFGASDDLCEFRGAINDEDDCYETKEIMFDDEGVVPSWDEEDMSENEARRYFKRKQKARTLTAIWDQEGYSWIYKTDIPHATFEIKEGDDKYCRGIVFNA